jgi:hypothetical protein
MPNQSNNEVARNRSHNEALVVIDRKHVMLFLFEDITHDFNRLNALKGYDVLCHDVSGHNFLAS